MISLKRVYISCNRLGSGMFAGVVMTSQAIMLSSLPCAATIAYPTMAVPGSMPRAMRVAGSVARRLACSGSISMLALSFIRRGNLFRDVRVGIHVLYVVQVFQLLYQAHDLVGHLLLGQCNPGLGDQRAFCLHHFVLFGFQHRAHFFEIGRIGVNNEALVIWPDRFNIVRAHIDGLER